MIFFFVCLPGLVNYYLTFKAEMLKKVDVQSSTEDKNIFDLTFKHHFCYFFVNFVSFVTSVPSLDAKWYS